MIRASASSSRRTLSSHSADGRSVAFHHDNDEEEEDLDGAPPMEAVMVCMAVVVDGPSIAFACYDEGRNEILLEALHASDDTEVIVERFMQTARPNLVLVGNKIVNNPSFLETITKPPPALPGEELEAPNPLAGSNYNEADQEEGMRPTRQSLPYRMLKSGAFEIRKCRALILQKLRVTSLLRHQAPEHAVGFDDPRRAERQFPLAEPFQSFRPSSYHSLAAVVDFDSKVQVQALGALLSFLQSTVFRLEDQNIVTVNRVVQAKSSLYMNISAATFSALHIFSTEHHPLIAKGPGNAKEGFSLYSLLDHTQSRGGQQLLREWMMKPLLDIQAIQERQDAVELFLQPRLETTVGLLFKHLATTAPVDKILTRMQKCATQPMDYIALARTLDAAVAISNILQGQVLPALEESRNSSHDFLLSLFQRCHAPLLADLQQEIVATIDEELTSQLKTSVAIRRGFHQELDEMKDTFDDLQEILEEVGAKIKRTHPELGLNAVFVPQVGFLASLDQELVMNQTIELPEDFIHIFSQDDEAFFKTTEMRELDRDIGDIHGLIKDMESMIVADLEEDLLDAETELRESFKALSELDCILSFASCAFELDFVRPRMLEATSNRISIKKGRHPLQEVHTGTQFVPNNVNLTQEERVNIITGPNFSGKSCYLRQVGVLVYMAHLGSFIPCEEAEICIVDQISARISTLETCAVPQSSFQLDLTEMAGILLRCTSKALVLIDEFGKGTSPASGIAILGATIKRLADIGCKTVCTTHFLELFSMGVIQDKANGIKARRMAINLPRGNEDNAAPLFKLEEGVASSSAGLICAKQAGVHPRIISRAKNIIQRMRDRQPIVALKEAMPQGPGFSADEVHMLDLFFSVENWEDATDDQIRMLIQKLSYVES